MVTMSKTKKAGIAFGILFFLTIAGIVINSGIQSTWWSVDVSTVRITTEDGYVLTGKLYLPEGVSSAHPGPAVLAIHGYNNDKDVQRPHAIELSKRGIIVLAIDVLNHGDSDYANTTEVSATPAAALEWLQAQPYVDETLTAVTGHSMGAFYTIMLALDPRFSNLRAIAPVAFSPEMVTAFMSMIRFFNPNIDILQVSSWGEEFGRDFNETINQHLQKGLDAMGAFLGIPDPQYDHTYGNFGAGATRFELVKKTHPGQTHSRKSTVAITAFFLQSLKLYNEEYAYKSINMGNTVYWIADLFGVISLAGLLFSIVPLAILFMSKKTFKEVAQPMPKYRESYAPKTWVWWIFGAVNAAIGAITYVFNTEYFNDSPSGGDWVFDGTMLQKWLPNIYRSGIASDFIAFFSVNAGIMILIVMFWYFVIYRPKRVGFYELGAGYCVPTDELEGEKPNGGRIFGKTVALAAILFVYMYFVTYFASSVFLVELRGPWAGLKLMTPERAGDYFQYWIPVFVYWVFNAGIWMFGMMRQKERKTEAGTVFVWWIKICVVMVSGLVLLNLISYVPMYIGLTGPYLNKLSFAPMNLLQLWSFIPYACGFYLVAIILFRKTGKIWLGTLMCSAITAWMLVTGYIMF
jgi:pimeloyl-ACP methyl ester carboxylesterase